MAKLKTHSGSKKRFKITATGKVKRSQGYKNHILTEVNERKRQLHRWLHPMLTLI